MDGILRIATTSNPSTLAYIIRSYDYTYSGVSEIVSDIPPDVDVVDDYMTGLAEAYLADILASREEQKLTVHQKEQRGAQYVTNTCFASTSGA